MTPWKLAANIYVFHSKDLEVVFSIENAITVAVVTYEI